MSKVLEGRFISAAMADAMHRRQQTTQGSPMNIFLTGSTGYIGGTVAVRLIAAGHSVRGLVRTREGADRVAVLGIEPVLGDLANAALLRSCAGAADAVVNTANADDHAAVDALLSGLAGSDKVFVHTSGSGVVADCADWQGSDVVYDDDTPIHPLPQRAARAALNEAIVGAAADDIRTIVIVSPMIYGQGLGVHAESIQMPRLLAVAKRAGVARYVGAGANRWSNVHVEDLADLYLLAIEHAPSGLYCHAENGETSMKEIAEAISRSLGLAPPSSMTIDQAIDCFGEMAARYNFGSNSRVRRRKARELLGWSPTRRSLAQEIERGCYSPAARGV